MNLSVRTYSHLGQSVFAEIYGLETQWTALLFTIGSHRRQTVDAIGGVFHRLAAWQRWLRKLHRAKLPSLPSSDIQLTAWLTMAQTKLVYPKMPGSSQAPTGNCHAFEKYDGTNIHWVWDATLGWYAFGTRRDRFDLDEAGIAEFNAAHPGLEECSGLFLTSLASQLSTVLGELQNYESNELIVFTEFLGDNSFAGKHLSSDKKRLVIIDIQTQHGFLSPERFERELCKLPIARTVYRGKLTGKFADDVREGRFGVAEGVVCKGVSAGNVWMVKIKTNAYMQRLKAAFAGNWESYWE